MTDAEELARLEETMAAIRKWNDDDTAERGLLWPLQMMHRLHDAIERLGLVELARQKIEGRSP